MTHDHAARERLAKEAAAYFGLEIGQLLSDHALEAAFDLSMGEMQTILRAITAALSSASEREADETGWLIERGEWKSVQHYFHFILEDSGIEFKHWGWTCDPNQASRFARKIDAELAWRCMTKRDLADVNIYEHMWPAPPCDHLQGQPAPLSAQEDE